RHGRGARPPLGAGQLRLSARLGRRLPLRRGEPPRRGAGRFPGERPGGGAAGALDRTAAGGRGATRGVMPDRPPGVSHGPGVTARPGRRLKSRGDPADASAHGTATKHDVRAKWSTDEGSARGPRGGGPLRCRLRPGAGRIDPPGRSRRARRAGRHGVGRRALAGHGRRFREPGRCPGPPPPARDARPGPRRRAGAWATGAQARRAARGAAASPRARAGGARVTVTACGRSSTRLLFNYGPKAVNGLPPGFPANLPTGTYALSYAASGVVSIPETPLATLPNLGIHAFARAVVTAFQQVAAAYASPECSITVRYSPFDGSSFTATFSVTCTVDGAS